VLNDTGTAARRSIFIVDQTGKVSYVNPAYDVRRPDHFAAIFDELTKLEQDSGQTEP
jgi:peroxiredoxin